MRALFLAIALAAASTAADAQRINVALAANGGTAFASSSYGPSTPVSSVIDDERNGVNWGAGGGWEDGTHNAYPDWVEVRFSGPMAMTSASVFTLRDNFGVAGPDPDFSTTFTKYGIRDFTIQYWDGVAWVTAGTFTNNNFVKSRVFLIGVVTDRIRVNVTAALYFKSRIVEIEALGEPAIEPMLTNVAAASNGGVASASSTYGPGAPASAVIDGNRAGANWGSGGGWEDMTYNAYPDWVQVEFNEWKRVSKAIVYTLRDSYGGNSTDPTDTETTSLYGLIDFTVQAWDGFNWVTVGTVAGNDLVKRIVEFEDPVNTNRIRIHVTAARYFKSRIVEVEVGGVPAPETEPINLALPANGTTSMSVSSNYGGGGSDPTKLVDGIRTGANWGSGGGWEDATHNAWPDWVTFNIQPGLRITHVVLYTLRDGFGGNMNEPTGTETFSLYGVTDFMVQRHNGTDFETVETVTANNLVKRVVTMPGFFQTGMLRVLVNDALYYKTRLVEVEVWGYDPG